MGRQVGIHEVGVKCHVGIFVLAQISTHSSISHKLGARETRAFKHRENSESNSDAGFMCHTTESVEDVR